MTAILGSPLPEARANSDEPGAVAEPQRQVEEVIRHLFAHTRYLLTLKAGPPFNSAGLETYERLHHVAQLSLKCLSHHLDLCLVALYQGLQTALAPVAWRYHEFDQGLESHFRDLQHRLLRSTGQKGGRRRALHRLGAWELLKRPPSESECLEALRHISDEELAEERQRVDQHRQRFRFEVRSVKSADAQLDRLYQQWLAIPKQSTG